MDFDMLFSLLRTFIALMAVLALAYLALRVGQRFNSGNSSIIKILEKTTLSNHSYLAVAKVGSNYHLISVTSGDIKILKDISAEEVEIVMEEKSILLEERKELIEEKKKALEEKGKLLKEYLINKLMQVRKKA